MATILNGKTIINGVDIYDKYGAWLAEVKKGERKNLKALYTPSKTKAHVAVKFREQCGEKHASKLVVANEARDVELTFCVYAPTKSEWIERFNAFVAFLKNGDTTINNEVVEGYGWLNFEFPTIDLELKMFYQSCTTYSPLTYLWVEGVQASHFKVKFREPNPKI